MTDRQLHAALDTIPGLVWLAGVDGAAEYLNRRWLEYSGLSQTQAIGWGWTAAVHPDDVDQLTDVWRRVLKAGVRGEAEARLRGFDGEYRWFLFTADPLHDESGAVIGWCGTNIDITEQRQAKAALEARERELSLIIETIPAFVWSASTDGRLIYVNQRLFDYIGAPMEVLRGKGWANFVHPDDRREAIDRWLHSVATGAPLENQYRLRRADGVYRWFHVPGQLGRTADGRPTLWYGLLIDIDDRKSVEEALRLTQTKLSRATQIATVGEIAASIAHEINQPIAAAATNASAALRWLQREPPNMERAIGAIDGIANSAQRAGEIVNSIRALIKKTPQQKEPFEINEAIQEVLILAQGELRKNGISVVLRLGEGLPHLEGDRTQLQQVMLNLINNAVQAMSDANVESRELLILTSWTDRDGIIVEVRDSGLGLDPANSELVFDAFYTTKLGGLGMGLSICRSIIEAHGGRLWASANMPRGATFQFTLPVGNNGP